MAHEKASESKNMLQQYGNCSTISMMDFMKIWKNYDSDKSGFIEVTPNEKGESEFEKFLVDLMEILFDQKLSHNQIKEIEQGFIKMYDTNKDGKFGMNELMEILPVEESELRKLVEKSDASSVDVDKIFEHYDKDNSGKIQEEELDALVKDLLCRKESDAEGNVVEVLDSHLADCKKELLAIADVDGDGQISKAELVNLIKLILKK